MGLLRILLALAVVTGHISWYRFMNGEEAVSIFFVISGFYMSLVLRNKYEATQSGRIAFWKARILRLYPSYWVVLAMAAASQVLLSHGTQLPFGTLSPIAKFESVTAQLAIVGQDAITFSGIDPAQHNFFLLKHFRDAAMPGFQVLLIPPAWSLSVEVLFYVLAPFLLVRNLKWVGGVFVGLLALRYLGQTALDLHGDPWEYRFFPFELNLFLAGAIAQQLYDRFKGSRWFGKQVGYWCYPAVALFVFAIGHSGLSSELCGLIAAPCLPFVFHASKSLRVDRWIGELSYPLYICHWPLLGLYHNGTKSLLIFFAACFILSAGLLTLVDLPIDKIRQKLVRKSIVEASPA